MSDSCMTIIECANCGEPCGKQYPADQTDPGFREGKGEEFCLPDDRWCCSEECREQMMEEQKPTYEMCKLCRLPIEEDGCGCNGN